MFQIWFWSKVFTTVSNGPCWLPTTDLLLHFPQLNKKEASLLAKKGYYSGKATQSKNWAPTVEMRPLSSVPCVYSTCIKEAFISLEQIINTFHQRCEGGGLALEKKIITIIIKSCPKCELNKT